MAMTANSGSGGISSEINVTPLIDVLLVLLIIFMVIVPVAPKGLGVQVPQPSKQDNAVDDAIVVSVSNTSGLGTAYKINQESVAKGDLFTRLSAIYANRGNRVMFVRGDDSVQYAQVAEVIDMGRSAGADHVGLMTPKIESGQ